MAEYEPLDLRKHMQGAFDNIEFDNLLDLIACTEFSYKTSLEVARFRKRLIKVVNKRVLKLAVLFDMDEKS